MKKVYVAHPLRGDQPDNISHILRNMGAVDDICARIVATEPETLPLSPINAFSFLPPQGDQSAVFNLCRALLAACDELRVFGDWERSEGCRMEIEHARALGLPVVFMEVQEDLDPSRCIVSSTAFEPEIPQGDR